MNDTDRLLYVMEGIDGFVNVDFDKYEYAARAAKRWGRAEPNKDDEIEGIRRLIDEAMTGYCALNGADCDSPDVCRKESRCVMRSC